MPRKPPFWRTRPLCDTSAVYTLKPLLSSHFSVLRQKNSRMPSFIGHPGTCILCVILGLIFLFFTFQTKTPLCILSPFTLAIRFIHPDNPAGAWPGWGGGACAGLWPRSGAPDQSAEAALAAHEMGAADAPSRMIGFIPEQTGLVKRTIGFLLFDRETFRKKLRKRMHRSPK